MPDRAETSFKHYKIVVERSVRLCKLTHFHKQGVARGCGKEFLCDALLEKKAVRILHDNKVTIL